MGDSIHAFVDEYGDTSIAAEKHGVTSFFILTAVLIRRDVDAQRASAEAMRRRFFQTGEMKSSAVAGDDHRRIQILEQLSSLELGTYILAVNKRELSRESGLAYKRSFFKYICRRLYSTIYRAYENVTLVADEHGTEQFMNSFEAYLGRRITPSLFTERSFRFANSKEEVLLQVADFISGSIARVLDPKKRSPAAHAILKLIAKQASALETWPPSDVGKSAIFSDEMEFSSNDELIQRHCLRQAQHFLDKNEAAAERDERIRAQIEALRFLLFKVRFVNPHKFVSTGEVLHYLASTVGLHLTEHQFRSTVIGPLRDAGVVLSSGSTGYKIPVCESDIHRFLAHADTIIPRMLDRISRARRELKMVSGNAVDILRPARFQHLRSLVEVSRDG